MPRSPWHLHALPAVRDRALLYARYPCHICGQPKTKSTAVSSPAASVHACPDCGLVAHCSPACATRDVRHADACATLADTMDDEAWMADRTLPKPALPPPPPYPLPSSWAGPPLDDGWTAFFASKGCAPQHVPPRVARLWSHAFTFPLTLAWAWSRVAPHVLRPSSHSPVCLHVVGAGPEARLPPHQWDEFLYQHPELACGGGVTVHFIGPDVIPQQPRASHWGTTPLRVQYHRALYHDAIATLPAPTLTVAFNSGIGFTGALSDQFWGHTVRHWFRTPNSSATKTPLLFTSFDSADQAKDLRALAHVSPCHFAPSAGSVADTVASPVIDPARWWLPPCANPFASLRLGIDYRHDMNHTFAPNARAMGLWI
jgi:hypothetical protein